MGRTFAVSGFGRSGTKWLADLADRSAVWTVEHEPGGAVVAVDAGRARFAVGRSGGNYGEVNSYLLPALWSVGAEAVGIILRCPRQIVVSCMRRGHALTDSFLDYLEQSLALVDAAVDRGARAISFRDMVGSTVYAQQVLADLGVEDVPVTPADLEAKVNASTGRLTWAKLGPGERDVVTRRLDWFTRKYETLLDTVSA